MDVTVTGGGWLAWDGRRVRCALGRGGIRADKVEGDGATPAGCFAFRRAFYRPDRLAAPATRLTLAALTPAHGWCDDPGHPDYNRETRLPHPARCETLWRDDGVYDLIVVLGHNDDPVMPGKGSAVFLHLARDDFGPTEGCVALAPADLLALLAAVGPGDRLCVVAG
ncbi:MAG: L,D-transpeptidase family protein [Magnetospirillum sp.]|nr:L,D-transpeptidase family protein [Magnetospirillum sp.]